MPRITGQNHVKRAENGNSRLIKRYIETTNLEKEAVHRF